MGTVIADDVREADLVGRRTFIGRVLEVLPAVEALESNLVSRFHEPQTPAGSTFIGPSGGDPATTAGLLTLVDSALLGSSWLSKDVFRLSSGSSVESLAEADADLDCRDTLLGGPITPTEWPLVSG